MDGSILAAPPRPPGIWRQGWYRFRRSRGGILGLALVGLVVAVALSCFLLAPGPWPLAPGPCDPNDQSAMLRGASREPAAETLKVASPIAGRGVRCTC
ncbi:MAG: Peptide/nickel transport system permease protein [Belnapia sp.]|nr:Peptide/nickel transport system permease protein [Belnapia sp.]